MSKKQKPYQLTDVVELANHFGDLLQDRMPASAAIQYKWQESVADEDTMVVLGAAVQIVLLAADQLSTVNLPEVQKDNPNIEWTQKDLFGLYVQAIGFMAVGTAEQGEFTTEYHEETKQ